MVLEEEEGLIDGLHSVALASVAPCDGGGGALAGALVGELGLVRGDGGVVERETRRSEGGGGVGRKAGLLHLFWRTVLRFRFHHSAQLSAHREQVISASPHLLLLPYLSSSSSPSTNYGAACAVSQNHLGSIHLAGWGLDGGQRLTAGSRKRLGASIGSGD